MQIVDALPPPETGAGSADPAVVAEILHDVRDRGDAALHDRTMQFDHRKLEALVVPPPLVRRAFTELDDADRKALEHALRNVRAFAEAQRRSIKPFSLEIEPGVLAEQRIVPVDRVACYVPGGRYPLPSTVLMTVVPAVVAGVREVIVLSPPGPDGWPNRYVLAAAHLAGATTVHPVGGVQAIGAAAYGTHSIAPCNLIVGPGNSWVTEAKRQVFGRVGIDALAGPSEVLVLLDRTADLIKVAADLLAQAEHDPDAHALAVTDERAVAEALCAEVMRQLATLPTKAVAAQSIARHGHVAVVHDRAAMVAAANARAPEHLEICTMDPQEMADACTSYGCLFVGGAAAEVFGDYCTGPSHVLPTLGAGRYTGGLSVHTFLKVLSVQSARPGSVHGLARTAAHLARVEGLEGHARAAEARLR